MRRWVVSGGRRGGGLIRERRSAIERSIRAWEIGRRAEWIGLELAYYLLLRTSELVAEGFMIYMACGGKTSTSPSGKTSWEGRETGGGHRRDKLLHGSNTEGARGEWKRC